MSTSALPPSPNLEQLKKQAKDLLKAACSDDPAAASRFRAGLPRFAELPDEAFSRPRLSLKDAQLVIALEHGFDGWPSLRKHVSGEPRYFRDYRYSRRYPVGVDELDAVPQRQAHVVFRPCDGGVAVEQFDASGAFVRLCYHPDEKQYGRRWDKKRVADDTGAVIRDTDGSVVLYEKYFPCDEVCADGRLVRSETYNVEGRLIETQEPRRVSDTAYDLYIRDTSGKLKGVIHHRSVDRGEPYDISEDWLE